MSGEVYNGQAASHGKAVTVLREELVRRDPVLLARNTGARMKDERCFLVTCWDRELSVSFPDFTVVDAENGGPVDERTAQLVIHYFYTADGTEGGGKWVSLAELPDGAFYRQAYQGYSGNHLAMELQNDLKTLQRASVEIGGKPEEFGDLSYSFTVLPCLSLLLVYWRGDEEFPPSAQVLFSDSASHYLPTDICAALGRQLVDRLLEARDTLR